MVYIDRIVYMKGGDNLKQYTIYMHISPNNKRYIGITCQKSERRWSNGKGYKSNKYFYKAINKYGWDNFQHIIIARGLDEETAKWLEIELIKKWDTTNPNKGYNITKGGESANGWIPSKETREKISKANKGLKCSEETKQKIRKSNMGKQRSEETKQKLSEVHKGMGHTEETKQKLSELFSGIKNPMYGNGYLIQGKNNGRATSVICLTTKRIFFTIKEGCDFYNKKGTADVSKCCKGKRKSAGKLEDGTPLVWRYLVWKHDKKYRIIK